MNTILEAINFLNKATEEYDKGTPIISDKEYDDLYFRLKELEEETGIIYPSSPTQTIHYDVVSQLNKKKHDHPMLSLDKIKDWDSFITYFNGYQDVIGMLKMDGLTCSLTYENGRLIGAETRGNGEVGEDILHNAKVIKNIPQTIPYNERLVVDGEIISTYTNFEKFSNTYANPRNFAAGSIRLLDSEECAKRGLEFVVWYIVEGFNETNSLLEKFGNCSELGFTVVPWTSSLDLDAKDFLLNQAKTLSYPIDGLVGRYDDIEYGKSLGLTGHHIKAAYAFKFYDETYETKLRNIEWTMGRMGTLTPVAIFDPIEIEGATISRANLHNLNIMEEQVGAKPFEGQVIHVYRANQIIPQISEADNTEEEDEFYLDKQVFSIPTSCPYCGQPTSRKIGQNTIELYCSNDSCDGKIINRLDHMLGKKGLDAKGISKANLEKLIDWGWIARPTDIFNLAQYRAEWINKPGYGVKSVDKILGAIEAAKSPTLEAFIASIGIPLIGHNVAKELVKYIESYEDLREKVNSNYDFSQIPNFGEAKSSSLLTFNYEDADEIYKHLSIKEKDILSNNTQELADLVVAITGKLFTFKNRSELEELITSKGGRVVKSISSKTNLLINNDSNSTSTKNREAKERGIPIMTEEEFVKTYIQST